MKQKVLMLLVALIATMFAEKATAQQINIKTERKAGEELTFAKVKTTDGKAPTIKGATIEGEWKNEGELKLKLQKDSINIEGNIVELDCSKNDLTYFDARECKTLEVLDCSDNKLETPYDLWQIEAYKKNEASVERLMKQTTFFAPTSLIELNCSGNKFKALALEWFPNLKVFNCSNTPIGMWDLKKLPELEILTLNDNAKLVGSADLSKSTKLKRLICIGAKFSMLDVSKCSELEFIDCSNSKARRSILKCGNNPKLKKIVGNNSKFGSMNNWNCPALEEVYFNGASFRSPSNSNLPALKRIYAKNNNTNKLDLSCCPALEVFDTSDGMLEELDITKCTKLDSLNIANNKLATIDLKNNTELTSLICNNNGLLVLSLTNQAKLAALTCNHNAFEKEEVVDIIVKDICDRKKQGLENGVINFMVLNDETEKNTITEAQAIELKKKGWIVNRYETEKKVWEEYKVSVPQFITITTNKKAGEELTLAAIVTANGTQPKVQGGVVTNKWENGKALNVKLNDSKFTLEGEIVMLDCQKMGITNIDLSKNEMLENLTCFGNEIETLDLSHNAELKTLHCNNNKLKDINLKKNVKLELLMCYKNELTTLDLAENAALKTVYANDNKIESVKFAENAKIKILVLSNNATLKTINLANCKELSYLYLDGCPMAELNVKECKMLGTLVLNTHNLKELDVTNCPELTSLECANGALETLDLSKNEKLEVLSATGNKLSEIDFSKNPYLRIVAIDLNNIKETQMEKCVESLCDRTKQKVKVGFFGVRQINNKAEKNEINKKQVKALQAKGWKTKEYDANKKQWQNIDMVALGIKDEKMNGEPTIVSVYTLNGQRIEKMQRGVNIVKMSDGTTRKIMK